MALTTPSQGAEVIWTAQCDQNGNPLTGGSQVQVTNFPSNQTVSGTINVGNFPGTQTVSGSVSVSNFPGTQTVSGTVNIGNYPTTQGVDSSAASGAISTSPANGSSITANTDFSVTFSQQVSHIAIENNTTAAIQWELDAATGNSSLHLSNTSPGNILFLDVKVTVLHLLSTIAATFNGSGGINVRGWT